MEALPPEVVMDLQGSQVATVIQSVLTLSGMTFEEFDSDAREDLKQAILSGTTIDAIRQIPDLGDLYAESGQT